MPSSPAVQPLLALLAYPVGGNPTQYMIEKVVARHDLDWRYLTFEVRPEELGEAVRGLRALGFFGAHCGVPHKESVAPMLDRVSDTASAVGAVNFIYREESSFVGDNTEGRGAVEAIRGAAAPAGKRVVMLGAGRMARATAFELASVGAAEFTIVNRTESRAAALAELLAEKFHARAEAVAWQGNYVVPEDADLLVHATSAESGGETIALPLAADSLRPDLIVADATAFSARTWLLDESARRSCRVIDGLTMFVEQVAIGFRHWTGVDPDRSTLRDAAEEFFGF